MCTLQKLVSVEQKSQQYRQELAQAKKDLHKAQQEGCLLPHLGRTGVQWSQIRFSGSEPRVVGSSWKSFPVWWRLANRSSNCMVKVFIRSTACDVAKESQASFRYHVGKRGHPTLPWRSFAFVMTSEGIHDGYLVDHWPSNRLCTCTAFAPSENWKRPHGSNGCGHSNQTSILQM